MLPTPRATDGTKGGPNQRGSSGDLMLPSAVMLLPTPTPTTSEATGPGEHGTGGANLRTTVALLPTPAVNDMGEGKTVEHWDGWTADMKAKHGNGNGHGKSLAIEAQRLLPTPSVADSEGGHERRGGARGNELLLNGLAKAHAAGELLLPTPMVGSSSPAAHGQISGQYRDQMAEAMTRWGDYAPAIRRWEQVHVGPAPTATQTSAKGNPQLSPRFTEWLMGLEPGWITDVPEITRNEALKACGNGVVPQQGAAALRWLLAVMRAAIAA